MGFGDQKCDPSFNINQNQGTVSAASSVSGTEESLITKTLLICFLGKKTPKKAFWGTLPFLSFLFTSSWGWIPNRNCLFAMHILLFGHFLGGTALESTFANSTNGKNRTAKWMYSWCFSIEPPPFWKKNMGGKSSKWINFRHKKTIWQSRLEQTQSKQTIWKEAIPPLADWKISDPFSLK